MQAAQPVRRREVAPGPPGSMSFGLATFLRENLGVFAWKDHPLPLFLDDLQRLMKQRSGAL